MLVSTENTARPAIPQSKTSTDSKFPPVFSTAAIRVTYREKVVQPSAYSVWSSIIFR